MPYRQCLQRDRKNRRVLPSYVCRPLNLASVICQPAWRSVVFSQCTNQANSHCSPRLRNQESDVERITPQVREQLQGSRGVVPSVRSHNHNSIKHKCILFPTSYSGKPRHFSRREHRLTSKCLVAASDDSGIQLAAPPYQAADGLLCPSIQRLENRPAHRAQMAVSSDDQGHDVFWQAVFIWVWFQLSLHSWPQSTGPGVLRLPPGWVTRSVGAWQLRATSGPRPRSQFIRPRPEKVRQWQLQY